MNFLTNLLGIDPNERYNNQPSDLNSRAYQTLSQIPAHVVFEQEPSVGEYLREFTPTKEGVIQYVISIFPSATWITRYKAAWLLGDVIAGITIGLVVVPQAMAYALLAQLTPAYGLYTSFTGAVLYWLFGTSKDIVIGTTAVGSLLVGQVISSVKASNDSFTNEQIAHTLSLLSGAVLLLIGLLRLGWIVEFIPYIPVSAFVTAASITIMCTQIPTALGLPDINTREAPYKVIIEIFKKLGQARLDAAIGITCIVLLFAIRDGCSFMEKKRPHQKRIWSTLSSLRLTFAMLLYTFISFLINRSLPASEAKFRIVGHIDIGFQRAGLPQPTADLLKLILPQLPAVAIILVIEHIAIAKAMGRNFGYSVDPSQEIVALGAANVFSPFVGGYVCTGSFGASAVLSKAGVRTPLAGVFSAFVLVLALYVLTKVFFFIPNAALAGLIIHAVCNLLTPPKNLYKYWQLSPIELFIWVTGVVLAIFESLEISIYVGMALSLLVMLVRNARTKGQFLGVARVRTVVQEKVDDLHYSHEEGCEKATENRSRDVYLPLDKKGDAKNPNVEVDSPHPGVFIYRFNESYNYTNQARHIQLLVSHILTNTQRRTEEYYEKESDRLWNDPGPRQTSCCEDERPYLRSVVFDFATTNNIDITAVQGLVDLRNTLDKHCAPDAVEIHFANVHSRWTRRALAAAGFGFPSPNQEASSHWRAAYTIAPILEDFAKSNDLITKSGSDVEGQSSESGMKDGKDEDGVQRVTAKEAAVYGVDRPFFHVDLGEAVEAAVRGAEARDGRLVREGSVRTAVS